MLTLIPKWSKNDRSPPSACILFPKLQTTKSISFLLGAQTTNNFSTWQNYLFETTTVMYLTKGNQNLLTGGDKILSHITDEHLWKRIYGKM